MLKLAWWFCYQAISLGPPGLDMLAPHWKLLKYWNTVQYLSILDRYQEMGGFCLISELSCLYKMYTILEVTNHKETKDWDTIRTTLEADNTKLRHQIAKVGIVSSNIITLNTYTLHNHNGSKTMYWNILCQLLSHFVSQLLFRYDPWTCSKCYNVHVSRSL